MQWRHNKVQIKNNEMARLQLPCTSLLGVYTIHARHVGITVLTQHKTVYTHALNYYKFHRVRRFRFSGSVNMWVITDYNGPNIVRVDYSFKWSTDN